MLIYKMKKAKVIDTNLYTKNVYGTIKWYKVNL